MTETRRHRRRVKFVAGTLSTVFAFTQVLFAHVPTVSVWESRRAAHARPADDRLARLMEATTPISAINSASRAAAPISNRYLAAFNANPAAAFLKLLPPEIVTVRDLVLPTGVAGPLAGRRFIVVQDVHLNADAQRNIADLLFRLMGADQAGIVAVEGAVGLFDLARFRSYPDRSVTDAVARAFLVSNRIGAPSFAGITSKANPPLFWGVDDAEHYDRNVDAYRAGLKARPGADDALSAEATRLSTAKQIVFTPALNAIDAATSAYESGEKGLGDHLEFLSGIGALELMPAAAQTVAHRFLDAWRLERRLDFDRADRERRAALEKLVSKLSKVEIDGLVSLSLGYRDGSLTFGAYHRAISGLLESKGVSLAALPAFQTYLRYVLLSDGINADQLLAATAAAQAAAFERAAVTPEQRRLVTATRRLALKKKLLEFSLTPVEWTEYALGGPESSSRGGPQGRRGDLIDEIATAPSAPRNDNLQPFEDFYREAHVRSERIADNLAKAARRTDASKVGVLIIGGFHAPEVGKRLAEMGASYAVVSPKLAKVEAGTGTAYLSVFSREKTPLQKLFEGEKLFVYPAHLDIGAAGAHTDAANNEFQAAQLLAGDLRAGRVQRGVAKATVGGREFAAVAAGARVPFGYSAITGAVEAVEGSPVQFVRRTMLGSLISSTPLGVTGWFGRLAQALGFSKETSARLSFLEEVFYTGLLVYALPWALVSLGVMPVTALDWVRPVMFGLASIAFALGHPEKSTWTADGRIDSRPATAGSYVATLAIGVLFRSAFFFGFAPGLVLVSALAGHAFWNNAVTPLFRFLPVMMTIRTPLWWQHADRKFVAMSVPIYALRRDPATDPGIGKFTDLGRAYREKLRPQGVDVVLLLPHYATLDESPYAPVSLFAVQERYIDWSQVPEVAADARLQASLVAPAEAQVEIDYDALRVRENRVAEEAFRRFQSGVRADTERSQSYALFLRQNRGWLREYADFMAIHQILGKSSVDWTEEEMEMVRLSPRYLQLYELHSYKQWIGYRQFAEALNDVQAAGGHVLIDIPFFRAKDSVAVRNNPEFFRDPKNRSAGIRNANTDQTWGDLALWNWPELARGSYDYVLGPIRHWLRFGVDGGRNDASHFYYRIGQFGENDEPGDAVVSRLASTFEQYGALPVAEAFEGKGDEVARHGIVVVDGNWQRVSTHDDGARPHLNDPINFFKDLLGRLFRRGDPRSSQFVAYTLGDLDGDPRTVKRMEDGRSLWRYRQSLNPPRDLGRAIRFYRQTLPAIRAGGRRIWDAAVELRDMFESATESFVKFRDGRPEIWAASRDWFAEQWGRDTFIALPGIMLATRRFDQARELIRSFARFERNGLVPNRIWDPSNPDTIEYNTSDGSMWFIQAVKSYVEATGDTAFVVEMAPVMRRIMQGYINGTGWDGGKHINPDPALNDRVVRMDPADGLISVPGQSTWMDADPHGQGAVTPRNGKPVEINALWYSNLRFMAEALGQSDGAPGEAAQYTRIADQVKESFNTTFWNDHLSGPSSLERENALFDMAPGGPHNGAIRPNMLFAVSHGGDLLSPERQVMVFARAEADLWTPFGPRTLSPRDSNYQSRYETSRQPYPGEPDFPNHKDYAYHQGTVWPWLIGTYVDSLVKVRTAQGRSMPQIQDELRNLLEPIVNEFAETGSLHEVYDGSPRMDDGRQHPGGTSSQAWSVAELYRVLAEYGVLAAPVAAPSDWIADHAPAVAGKTVVEVTMEMALPGAAFDAMTAAGIDHETQVNAAMATSTGGIGPLLKERVIALGDLGANVVAFSLLYEHVWVQKVTKGVDGNPDTIEQEKVKIGDAFRAILIDAGTVDVTMFDGSVAKVQVWQAPAGMFGKANVYYFDYPKIADVVYPGNADGAGLSEAMRLAQNWMVGRGSLAYLKQIDRKPDITVMSEMPSTLSFHRLVEDEFTADPFFNDTLYVFNDHTPLEYAHPKWDAGVRERMRLRPMFHENQDLKVGDKVVGTAMIINAADAVYGVARKHGDVMRAMAPLQQFASKIQSVTNGVSASYWPTDEFRDAARAVRMSDDEIAKVKTRRRHELLRYLGEREHMPEGWADRMIAEGNSVGIWTRRLVGYKRMDVFASLVENDAMRERFLASSIIFVLGGRIHQDDPFGLDQFARIQAVMQRDPRLKDRVIFFENYNILDAPHLFRGADFSVMLADDGYEASATGFQKAQMNGDLIIASHDGAVPESVVFAQRDARNANGFEVPYMRVNPDPSKPMSPTPEGLMDAFSMFATARANPPVYANMVRNALLAAPRVDVVRTAQDMLQLLDATIRAKASEDRDYADGRQMADTYFSGKIFSAPNAQRALVQLGSAEAFAWKYKEKGVSERTLHQGEAGVQGFIDGYRHIRAIGTAGEWSLFNHASHIGGRGDVIVHLSAAFHAVGDLGVSVLLDDLGERARLAATDQDKLRFTRMAIGLAERSLDRLNAAAESAPFASANTGVPLGLLGIWKHFPNVRLGNASLLEAVGISVIALATLALMLQHPSLSPALGSQSVLGMTQITARVSMLVAGIVFPVVLFAHLVFGIMQPGPQRRPVWSAALALRGTVVAMSSLIGLPLIVFGAIAWVSAASFGSMAVIPLIVIGVAAGALAHRSFNVRLLEWYSRHRGSRVERNVHLRPAVRQAIIENTDPIMRYLSERTVTDIGPDVEALRERKIPLLPEGVVRPLEGSIRGMRVDALVVFGSHYLDVPARAARLYWSLREMNPEMVVIFAGGMGPRTKVRFPYWSSEAELFRDSFVMEVRGIRRGSIETKLAGAFGRGRYSDWLIQFVLLIDDLMFGYSSSLPRAIHLDTESTDTGANIRNVTRILNDRELPARNIMIMSAGVFQLRLRVSLLQQYLRPLDRLYSFSATRPDLNRLSDDELAELSDEARSQIDRLRNYPNKTPEPFTVPVFIPKEIAAAHERLTMTLENANLFGTAATSPSEKVARSSPTSLTRALLGMVAVGTLLSFVHLTSDGAAWGEIIFSSFGVVGHLIAAGLAAVMTYVLLFSQSVGSLGRVRAPRIITPLVSGLGLIVPLMVLSAYLWSSLANDAIPAWFSVSLSLLLGALARSWSMAVERTQELNGDAAGAIGAFAKTGLSLKTIGVIEGAATAAIALAAMGAALGLALLLPDAAFSSLGAWTALTAAGLAAGAAAIRWAHRRFGATVARGESPSFDPTAVARATRTAYLSLAGVPLLAAALLMPAIPATLLFIAGIVAAVVPHARTNERAERAMAALNADDRAQAARTAALLRELTDARRHGDDARLAAALAALTDLERLNLDAFGRETELARRDDNRVAYQLTTDPSAFVLWQYALTQARDGSRGFTAGTVGGFITETTGDGASAQIINRRDHVVIVASGRDEITLLSETRRALDVAQGRPLTVIISHDATDARGLGRAFPGRAVRFLRQADLDTAGAVENLLLKPALAHSARIKLLVHRDAGLPDFLVAPLLELGRQDRYRDLVELVIVTALVNGAFAVRASLSDIERAITFRELVLSQA